MNTQQIIMDEIMQSVYTLAQDQYGNYVIQVSKIFQLIQHACIDWQVKFFAPKIWVCPVKVTLHANPKIFIYICQSPLNMIDKQGRSNL